MISIYCARCGNRVGEMPNDQPLRQEHIHQKTCKWCKANLKLTGTVGNQPVVIGRHYHFCRQSILFDTNLEYEFKPSPVAQDAFWKWLKTKSGIDAVARTPDLTALWMAFYAGWKAVPSPQQRVSNLNQGGYL